MSNESTAFTRSWVRSGTKPQKRRVRPKLREERAQALIPTTSDFVHDQLAAGRGIRILTVADTFSRFSSQSTRASATRARMSWPHWTGHAEPGLSEDDPVDQGIEFISRDLDLWAYQRGVELDFS